MTVELMVVRHGETQWNAEGRLQGHVDVPLCDRGILQAQLLAEVLRPVPVCALVCSTLARARHTAQIIGRVHAVDLHEDPDLRERCFGLFEGLTWPEVQRLHPEEYQAYQRDAERAAPAGAEPLADLAARASAGLARSTRHARPGKVVVVVTHGGVMRSAMLPLLGPSTPRPVPNAIPYRFVFSAEAVSHVEEWNLGEAGRRLRGI